MSTKIGDMAIYISANTYGLGRDLARASSMVSAYAGSVASRMAALARPMASFARDSAAVATGQLMAGGIREAAKSAVDLAKSAEVSAMKFDVLLGSAKEAAALMGDLKAFAAASPVSLADAQKHAVSLVGAGVDRPDVVPTMKALTDVSMGDPRVLDSWVMAYRQVMATGRLQGDEWNQIANTGTLTFKDLAKVLKVDQSEVKKLIEAGKVGFYDLQLAIKAATDEGGRFHGLSARYAETYAGKLDKLTDAWDEAKREMGKGLIAGLDLKAGADGTADMVDKAKKLAKTMEGVARTVKGIADGFIDATSALYQFSQRAAALTLGDTSTLRQGEQARANLTWQETRASQLRGEYGLTEADAYRLFDQQTIYLDAKRAAESEAAFARTWRKAADTSGDAVNRQRNLDAAAGAEARAAAQQRVMAASAAESARIVSRGDPALITRGKDGGVFTPVKPLVDPRLSDLAGKLNEKFVDPLKKFADDLADLDKLKSAGRIDADVYALAVADLVKGIGGEVASRLPDAAELGSQQLAALVAQATAGQGPTSVPALLEQLRVQNAELIAEAQKIVANTGQAPVVATMPGN